jgi:hypothetical protein
MESVRFLSAWEALPPVFDVLFLKHSDSHVVCMLNLH